MKQGTEWQLPTLELCKELKELGYPQVGEFWWVKRPSSDEYYLEPFEYKRVATDYLAKNGWEVFVAPTLAEMGEWLPHGIVVDGEDRYFREGIIGGDRDREYINFYGDDKITFHDVREANSRAKTLKWLAENDYIDFKKRRTNETNTWKDRKK